MGRAAPRRPGAGWRPWAFGFLLSALVVVAVVVDLPSAEEVRNRIAGFGWAAPAVFVAAYAAITLVPLPKNVLSAAGGLLFGFVQGALLVWLAALVGASIAFGLARFLGRGSFRRLSSARVERLDALVARRGLLAVIGIRLVPIAPFTAINYLAGLTGVSWRAYAAGTAVGIVPGTLAYVALGAYGTDPGTWQFAVSVAALVVLSIGGVLVARHRRNAAGTGRFSQLAGSGHSRARPEAEGPPGLAERNDEARDQR